MLKHIYSSSRVYVRAGHELHLRHTHSSRICHAGSSTFCRDASDPPTGTGSSGAVYSQAMIATLISNRLPSAASPISGRGRPSCQSFPPKLIARLLVWRNWLETLPDNCCCIGSLWLVTRSFRPARLFNYLHRGLHQFLSGDAVSCVSLP